MFSGSQESTAQLCSEVWELFVLAFVCIMSSSSGRCVSGSGEYSDFQYITNNLLKELMLEDYVEDDGDNRTAKEIHSYLARVLYNRRSKMDPLYNQLIIAGVDGDERSGKLRACVWGGCVLWRWWWIIQQGHRKSMLHPLPPQPPRSKTNQYPNTHTQCAWRCGPVRLYLHR